jgi:hypothetical protein
MECAFSAMSLIDDVLAARLDAKQSRKPIGTRCHLANGSRENLWVQ